MKQTKKEAVQKLSQPSPSPSAEGAMPHERFLDKQDLMQMLHVSLRTLYNWRTKGKLPFVKVEQKIFYRQTDLERLLKTGRGNSEW